MAQNYRWSSPNVRDQWRRQLTLELAEVDRLWDFELPTALPIILIQPLPSSKIFCRRHYSPFTDVVSSICLVNACCCILNDKALWLNFPKNPVGFYNPCWKSYWPLQKCSLYSSEIMTISFDSYIIIFQCVASTKQFPTLVSYVE